MAVNIVLLQVGSCQRILRSHIGILCLLRHKLAEITIDKWFQIGFGYIGAERRTETSVHAFLTVNDTTLAFVQRLAHFIERRAQARPDAHSCNYYSLFHVVFMI